MLWRALVGLWGFATAMSLQVTKQCQGVMVTYILRYPVSLSLGVDDGRTVLKEES